MQSGDIVKYEDRILRNIFLIYEHMILKEIKLVTTFNY